MSADKWLKALQKVHPAPAPYSKPEGDPLTQVLLDTAFGNSGIDNGAIIEKATGIFETDPYVTALDPVGDVIEKATRNRFRVSEIAAPVEHPDGIEFERCAGMVFKFHWQGGNLVKSETFHPDTGWESVDEPLRPILVEDRIAKMIGVTSDERDLNDRVRSEIRYDLRRPSSPKEKSDLEAITDSLDELLGSYASMPADSKTKAFNVGGQVLSKGELSSKLFSLLENVRPDCVGTEYEQLEKAAKALDIAAFTQIVDGVVARLKSSNAAARESLSAAK